MVSTVTVAPHAGAWIETLFLLCSLLLAHVAPHAGAWIETTWVLEIMTAVVSRPPCGGVD